MAAIQPISNSVQVVPYANVGTIVVSHALNRYPEVVVLHVVTTGVFGFGDFGVGDFGVSDLVRPLDRVHHEIVHIDDTEFRVLFNNNYVGEIHYF